MKKVIRDGKVAILYSPGYGAGWYSWNPDFPECLFLPEIVELVEKGEHNKIDDDLMYNLLGNGKSRKDFYFYCGGASDLEIEWLPQGTHFNIDEYDGSESVQTFEDIKLIA